MKVYEGVDVRNVGIVGHGNCGKTTLLAGCLFAVGATNRLTRVDEGNTITDFDDEEVARKITIASSLAHVEWNKAKINFIDTPGYNIFINDTKGALWAADNALVVVDAVAGVEVQTEKVWQFSEEYEIPRVLFINRLARERADFNAAVSSAQDVLDRKCIPVQIPIGSEREFKGVIDLIGMKAYTYVHDGDGKGKESDIPADLVSAAEEAREAMIEMVAECDDDLLVEYLEELTLPTEKIVEGLRKGVAARKIFPVLCGSGLHNVGTDLLLNFLSEYAVQPTARGQVEGKNESGEAVTRKISDGEPVSLFVYKTVADAFAGRVNYFKVMSGVLKNDDHLYNYKRTTDERFSRFGALFGKDITPTTALHAGDIGAVAKLKDTQTGDTLGDKFHPIEYAGPSYPVPAIAYAIRPKTRQDEDRLGNAVTRILEEDVRLQFYRAPQTKEFLMAGNGQQHVEVIVSRLKKRYHVEVELHEPKIPYRETIRGNADVQGRHKKQTGGHGQFGDCRIRMEPLERGKKFEFVNAIFGGAIPKTYIPAVEKGILEAADRGHLAGFPVVDFKVTLYDGSYHDVDSSEMSFKLAGRKAFRNAMEVARPTLLEPVMNCEIVAPMDFAGDLMGDLNSRRGRIQGMETKGSSQIIKAQVPMSEMLSYANDLTSMTQGRGSFTMEFDHYDFVPQQVADKIVAAAQAARTGEEVEEE
jgi:elongation factor G